MLSLTYANRTERLLESLAEALRQERQAFGIWEPIQLVVPNPNVKRYLLDGLGKSLGILANFKVDYLDGLWRGPLGQMEPPVRLWNRHALQGAVLSVLAQPGTLEAPDLAPLKRYLEGEGADLKLMQLAERAAGLLEDYSLTRPEWAAAWASGRAISGAPADLEAWQRGLWNRMAAGTTAGPERWTTLAALLREGRFDRIPLPPRIHVFGLSYAAEVYHRAFEAAARRVDIHLYALNPCQEYWDDLPTEAEQRRRSQRLGASPGVQEEDPYGLESEADPLLLRRWGRPGRENVRLLNEISDCDFQGAFPEPDRATLLRRVQDALQHRTPCDPGRPDASLRILACPSPAREAEVVASEIWRLMEAAPPERPLRFSDIAVVVPPAEGLRTPYLDHLRTAFDATGRIPMVVVDAPSPALASLLDGAELLLDLPLGRGSRRELLRALTHPAVTAHFPDLHPDAWARWAEAAGIVRGLGPEDLAGEALVEPGVFHWEQGLERLALSAFLPADGTWSEGGFERPSAYAGDAAATGAFVDQASALLRRLRGLRTFHGPPAAWAERLADYLLAYLGGEDAADAGGRAKLAQALLRLASLVPPGLEPPILNYRQARDLASQALAGIRGEVGGRPHQGVVVGSYAPMRALPFRAVILMGLGEGQFPSPEERQPLDLRNAKRKPGDVGTAEQDRYLFLEMLLGARESLRLTYPTEDPVSKEARLPSSLVQDLVQSLAPLTLPDLQEQHPRYRFDEAYFPPAGGSTDLRSLAPSAHREARARAAGTALAASIPGTEDRPWASLPLPEPLRKDLDPLVDPCPTPSGRSLPRTLPLRLAHLRAWLECPVQGTAKVRLQLRDEEEDLAELEEEALGTSALHRALLRKEALLRVARQGQDPEEAYHEARRALQRAGRAAPGIFGQAEVQEDLELLRRQVEALRGERVRLVRFGPSLSLAEDADEVRPPLELAVPVHGESLKVRLVGSLQPQAGQASLFLLKQAGAKPKGGLTDAFQGKLLRAYLDQHLLAAASDSELTHGALGVAGLSADGKKSGAYRSLVPFSPLDPAAARTRLAGWITELLETREPGLLPIEALLEDPHWNAADLREWVLEKAESDRSFPAFKTGPLRRAERFGLDPDPAATAERRLGDFLRQAVAGTTEEVG